MSVVLLDTHAVHWWSAEPDRISKRAHAAIEDAEELAIAAISWYELSWLGHNGRIALSIPIRSWIQSLSAHLRTIAISPAIAETAAALPHTFPGDPADRVIYATAIEGGLPLITKDRALRQHPHPRDLTVW
jgi:PIN domain nuclease of toxin-antitoxin system